MKVKDIIQNARNCKKNVEKLQKLGVKDNTAYYTCKVILGAKDTVKNITIKSPKEPTGDYLSRQISKANYVDMAKRLVAYVEKNKQMPNYITMGKYKVEFKLYTYLFASALVTSVDTGYLPKQVNISSKLFKAKTETGNAVYDYFVKKTGKAYKYIDDFLDFCKINYTYQFYFDDHKSNKEVIDSKSGNCTDLSQMAWNMGKAMGYDVKAIHTKCKQSGTGHIYLKFKHKKNTNDKWITRDIACIVDERRSCVWCDVDAGRGSLVAVNPAWFVQNISR